MKQRQKKYRAWDGERMHYVEGPLYLSIWNDPKRIAWGVYDGTGARVADSQYGGVLMESTGLQDIQGKDVYDGDQFDGWDGAVIRWCDGCHGWSIGIHEIEGHCHYCDGDFTLLDFADDLSEGKTFVSGNIYENLPTNTTEG
jgi:hypothetical protein